MTESISPVSSGSRALVGSSKHSKGRGESEGTGDRDPLLLSSAELTGITLRLLLQSHLPQQCKSPFPGFFPASLEYMYLSLRYVPEYREVGKEIEVLKDEADRESDLLKGCSRGVGGRFTLREVSCRRSESDHCLSFRGW